MKQLFFFILMLIGLNSPAQDRPYNVYADADSALNQAIAQAHESNRHVLVQVGGNWCPWCVKLHRFFAQHAELSRLIEQNYVVVRVNYSKENKNEATMSRLQNPQRFGFPVLVILDQNGQRIHTQDTGLLEANEGYDLKKVTNFLQNWTKNALEKTKR